MPAASSTRASSTPCCEVPRDAFVPEPYRAEAYDDHPLPIAHEQTISQPYVVAVMLAYLQLAPSDVVLEIGTGSGYVTALLAELAAQVFSIERHFALAASARDVIAALRSIATSVYLPATVRSAFPTRPPSTES